jgi:hypothetical protein
MQPIAKAFLGASSPRLNRKDLAVGRGANYLRFPKRDIRPGLTSPFSSRACWFSDSENGRPHEIARDEQTCCSQAGPLLERSIERGLISFLQISR